MRTLVLYGLLALAPGSLAFAQAASAATVSPIQHALVGTIVRINGNALTLRLRNGREQQVDAGPAIAADAYSAPLFVGKAILVEGAFDGHGVLQAIIITKIASADESAPSDR